MNVSLYQAAAALNANTRWQDVISENLSSASIPGFKKQDMTFSAVQAGLMPQASAGQPLNYVLPSASSATSFTPGELKFTGGPTDVAIDGSGFFQVQLPNGGMGFTRDGEFNVNAQGQLVTKQGYPVMGNAGPIQLDRNNANPISISSTGEISQGSEPRGKLKVVDFSDPKRLTPISGGCFIATDPGLQPIDVPGGASVRQHYLEAANTTAVSEMASLIGVMRASETNQRVIQINDDRMGRAITELGSPN